MTQVQQVQFLFDHRDRIDRTPLRRLLLAGPGRRVEPRHQQQIVDESGGSPRLAHHLHQPVLPIGPGRRQLQQRFGAGDDAGQRRPEVVRGICQELAHLGLCQLGLGLCRFQGVEHVVERGRRPAEVGARSGGPQSSATGAVPDARGQSGHPRQGPEGGSHDGDQQCRSDAHGDGAGQQLDGSQPEQRVADVGLVGGKRQLAAAQHDLGRQLAVRLAEGDGRARRRRCPTGSWTAAAGRWWPDVASDETLIAGGEQAEHAGTGESVRQTLTIDSLLLQDGGVTRPVLQTLPQVGAQRVAEQPVDHQAQHGQHHDQHREYPDRHPRPQRGGPQRAIRHGWVSHDARDSVRPSLIR